MLRTLTLVCALALTGCDGFSDFVDDPLGDFQLQLQITDARIPLGDDFRVPVLPGEARLIEESIAPGLQIRSVDEIQALTLQPSAFTFEPIQIVPSPTLPSGTVRAFLAVDGYPVPGTPVDIEIVRGSVASLTPPRIATPESTLDVAVIEAFVASLPADERPALAAYPSLSVQQIRQQVQAVLSNPAVRITLGIEVMSSDPDNPLTGVLGIDSFLLSGIVTR